MIAVLFKSLCSSCFTFPRELQIVLFEFHQSSVVLCYELQLIVDKPIQYSFFHSKYFCLVLLFLIILLLEYPVSSGLYLYR